MESRFKEQDKEKFIEFLNFVAQKAKFGDMTIEDSINLYRLVAHMQQELLPKINDHILEVKRVVEANPEPEEKPKRGRPKKES